ncbi:asparagine synthetase B, partial [Vibrio anguillarum]|nr:asparagine synthetase B [Vibrio anguillarum]
AGHQPMISSTARYILAFNGEIYNHLDLRKQLEQEVDCCWRGHSDTETLLKGFDVWGIKATIIKTIGMFAMSIWDAKEKSLTLLRDRLGEKPLYYGWQNDILLFGSEL